jgi:hypothetical protein
MSQISVWISKSTGKITSKVHDNKRGARTSSYCEHASKLSPLEFAEKVIKGEIPDPVHSFDLDSDRRCLSALRT